MDVELIKKFAKFCKKELGINTLPKITLTEKRDRIQTTAGYIRGKEIIIYTKGRHIVDVCRSIAHELQHHKQWEEKEFNDTEKIQDVGGQYEDEANALAGQMIKKFAYSGHMELYESKKILTEGRVEDAKRQFPTIPTDLINYISSKDPSGNNKYLRWILKQLRLKTIITPELDTKSFLDDLIKILDEYNTLLPYYSGKGLDPNTLSDKIIKSPKDINSYDTIEQLQLANDMITPTYTQKQTDKDVLKSADVIYDGNDYLTVHIRTLAEVCYYFSSNPWCKDSVHGHTYFKDYSKYNDIFVIINKAEDVPVEYTKLMVLLNKEVNKGEYIQIYSTNDRKLSLDDINNHDSKLNDIIRMIEMWKESTNRSAVSIKYTNPKLYALTQFLNDDNLKHYKETNTTEFTFSVFPSFEHNDGRKSKTYYIGYLDDVSIVAKKVYVDQFKKNPKLLLRHPEEFPLFIYPDKLTHLVLNHLGFNDLYFDQSKIKDYYLVPPMKLKGEQIDENNSDLNRLKQLDSDLFTYGDNLKHMQKDIRNRTKKIEKQTKNIEELQHKLETFKIRVEQVKGNAAKHLDLQHKIGAYELTIKHYTQDNDEYIKAKNILEDRLNELKNQINEASDEYTEIVNKLDMTYKDKINYEYSGQQIKDAKNKIQTNVVTNPFTWIQKLKLKPEAISELVNWTRFGDTMFNQLTKNIKSFGPYRFVNQFEENKKKYYIFTDETDRNPTRK